MVEIKEVKRILTKVEDFISDNAILEGSPLCDYLDDMKQSISEIETEVKKMEDSLQEYEEQPDINVNTLTDVTLREYSDCGIVADNLADQSILDEFMKMCLRLKGNRAAIMGKLAV